MQHQVTHNPLPANQPLLLRAWLSKPELLYLRRVLESQALFFQTQAGSELSVNPADLHTQEKAQRSALQANRFLTTLSVLDDLVKEPSEIQLSTVTLTT